MQMKRWLAGLCMCALAGCAEADVALLLEEFQWKQRVVVMLADTPESPQLRQMQESIAADPEGWNARDLVSVVVAKNSYVAIGERRQAHLPTGPFWEYFDAGDAPFTVLLMGKDGFEKLRKQEAMHLEEIYSAIDAMPIRQRELAE